MCMFIKFIYEYKYKFTDLSKEEFKKKQREFDKKIKIYFGF